MRTAAIVLGVAVAACAGSAVEPLDGPRGRPLASSARPTPDPPVAEPTSSASVAVAPETAASASPSTAAACPEGMVLVEGDYCPALKMKCLKKWHAPQNHLWVCERFESPTLCEGEAKPMRFCIDRYEFPNREGERPMVMQNFYQAQLHCQILGKRICTETEWTKACEGPDNKPFPYGYVRDPTKCRGDQPWDRPDAKKFIARDPAEIERLWQGVVSGSQPDCVSDYGVHDMPGNADELAASQTHGKGPKSDFDNVTTGGPWYLGVRNQCRPKIYSHDESFAYYYLSWRCCAEPDGKPTDPRAPKQIERDESWDKVVWRAKHSWLMPFNPRLPGDPDYAAAGPDREPAAPRK